MDQVNDGGNSSRPPSCAERVAFSVFKYFPYGGLQLDLMRMAQEFVSRGIKVVVYCMNCDIEQIPEGMEFRKLPAKGWSNHRRARNFEKKLRKELENESFFAHIAFNRLTPADWKVQNVLFCRNFCRVTVLLQRWKKNFFILKTQRRFFA